VPNLIDGWKYHPFEPDDARHYLSIAESSIEFEDDKMLVKGFVLDTVTAICETVVPGGATTVQIDEVYEAWQKFAEEALDAGHLGAARSKTSIGIRHTKHLFWLDFLSTDRMASRFLRYSANDPTVLLPEREEGLKLEYMGLNLKLAQSYLLPESSDASLHPLRRVRAALKKFGVGRRLGLCAEKGMLMLLPGDTRPGDVVAVFRGATFPYILREAVNQDEGHGQGPMVIVGEAFVPQDSVNQAVSLGSSMTEMGVMHIV
jgi:hypothetical protein